MCEVHEMHIAALCFLLLCVMHGRQWSCLGTHKSGLERMLAEQCTLLHTLKGLQAWNSMLCSTKTEVYLGFFDK